MCAHECACVNVYPDGIIILRLQNLTSPHRRGPGAANTGDPRRKTVSKFKWEKQRSRCVCVCVCVLFSLFVNRVSEWVCVCVCVCVCVQLLRPDWEQRLFRSGTHHANLSNILNWLCNWVLRRGCKQKTSLAFFFPSLCVCVCVCVRKRAV